MQSSFFNHKSLGSSLCIFTCFGLSLSVTSEIDSSEFLAKKVQCVKHTNRWGWTDSETKVVQEDHAHSFYSPHRLVKWGKWQGKGVCQREWGWGWWRWFRLRWRRGRWRVISNWCRDATWSQCITDSIDSSRYRGRRATGYKRWFWRDEWWRWRWFLQEL